MLARFRAVGSLAPPFYRCPFPGDSSPFSLSVLCPALYRKTPHAYSSSKIVTLLDALKAEILGGADAAYDTLVEIQQLLQNGTSGLDALLAAVNNRVRFDAAQTLTAPEQAQARSNIGAVAASDVGNTDTDFVAVFEGALV